MYYRLKEGYQEITDGLKKPFAHNIYVIIEWNGLDSHRQKDSSPLVNRSALFKLDNSMANGGFRLCFQRKSRAYADVL
jgi:hypothetical protein